MTTKRFCDVCSKEIQSTDDRYSVDVSKVSEDNHYRRQSHSINKPDVCSECAKAIVEVVNARAK